MTFWIIEESESVQEQLNKQEVKIGDTIEVMTNNQLGYKKYRVALDFDREKKLEIVADWSSELYECDNNIYNNIVSLIHDGCVKAIQEVSSYELFKNNLQLLISVCNSVEWGINYYKYSNCVASDHDDIIREIQPLPSFELFKNNLQLLLMSDCDNAQLNHDCETLKIDKKQLVINILNTVYKLTKTERAELDDNIDTLMELGKYFD